MVAYQSRFVEMLEENEDSQKAGEDTSSGKHTTRGEGYLDVLQSACRQGYQAPARHEIQLYQRKPLPLPPGSLVRNAKPERDLLAATMPREPHLLTLEEALRAEWLAEEITSRSERVIQDFRRRSKHYIVSSKAPTWLTRVEKRAGNYQKQYERRQK